ncbi:hypothetical protein B0H13DRAFT_2348892 [Mycena leptocephala]|nr:hypothetical protein B0H13DRAFT_2348892 [Mycena leptocephala]
MLANDLADLERNVDAREQADLQRGIQASLGLDSSAVNDDSASTSNHMAGQSGSLPKRAQMDIGSGTVHATRASTAAARLAAETAAANATTGGAPPGVSPHPATAAMVLPGAANPVAAAPPPAVSAAPIHGPLLHHPPRPALPHIANPPTITGIDNVMLTANADPAQVGGWGPGTLIAYVSGGSSDPVAEAQDSTNLITNYLNMQPGQICVGAANACVLSTTAITLFVFTLFPPLSGFMGIVEGLTFANSPAGAQEAVNTIVHSLSTATTFIQLLMSHHDALPAHWTIQPVINTVLGSITVVPLELASPRGPRVVWCVFMMVTMTNIVFYNALHASFSRVLFVTPFDNTGHVRDDMSCRICCSIDHPSALCPFPDIPGWMGPMPTSLLAIPAGNSNHGVHVPDIMLGDMNIVEDAIDRLLHRPDEDEAVNALSSFKYLLGFKDGWRDTNPDEKAYTFTHVSGSHSRID